MREFVRLKRLCSPCALSPSAKLKFHPSIPFAGYGKADVDGRTRNIFEARANLTPRPHDQHPRIRASRNIRRLKRKGKKSSRLESRAILIPDNWKSFPNLERAWALILFSPQKKKGTACSRCEKRVSDPDEWCFALDFLRLLHLFLPTPPPFPSFLLPGPRFSVRFLRSALAANSLDFPCVFAASFRAHVPLTSALHRCRDKL